MRHLWIVFALLALSAEAQTCADYGAFTRSLALLDTAGDALRIDVRGSLAFVADGPGGLQIIDISDPGQPRMRGAALATGDVRDVRIDGSLAFVCSGAAGLEAFDVADPGAPRRLATLDTPGFARGIAVLGSWAFVADGPAGLLVADVSRPDIPRTLGRIELPGQAYAVAAVDSLAIVADLAFPGLHFVDVADGGAPRLLATLETPGPARGVAIRGDRAYVADDAYGLLVVDIADGSRPQILTGRPTSGAALSVALAGDRVYVGTASNRVATYDLADANAPRLVGDGGTTDAAWGIASCEGGVCVVERTRGVEVLSISPFEPSMELGRAGPVAWYLRLLALAATETHVFTTGSNSAGFVCVNVTDARAPWIEGFSARNGFPALGLDVASGYAFVTTYDEDAYTGRTDPILEIYDVRRPASPVLVKRLILEAVGEHATSVRVLDGKAYVHTDHKLFVLDVANPASPQVLGSVAAPGGGWMRVANGLACWVSGYDGMAIADVTAPAQPRFLGMLDTPGQALDLALQGTRAFIADYDGGLHIVELSDPMHASIVQTITFPEPVYSVATQGRFAYLACGAWNTAQTLRCLDIGDPAQAEIIGSVPLSESYARVAANSRNVFLSQAASLLTYPLQCERTTPVALQDLTATVAAGSVRLQWRATADLTPRFMVERAPGASPPEAAYSAVRQEPVSFDRNTWQCVDGDVVAGSTYSYRITAQSAEDGFVARIGPVTVDVPLRGLTLDVRPTPARGRATLRFGPLPRGHFDLAIYDLSGHRIRSLAGGAAPPGSMEIPWNGLDDRGRPVASGVYFARLAAGGVTRATRVVFLRSS